MRRVPKPTPGAASGSPDGSPTSSSLSTGPQAFSELPARPSTPWPSADCYPGLCALAAGCSYGGTSCFALYIALAREASPRSRT